MSASADARPVAHSARAGETFEDLASRYYGNARLASALRSHNAIAGELTPGTVIEVPLGDTHTIEDGETWGVLAERYWGDASLASAMPALVAPPSPELEPGTELRIPALITHRVQAGESFAVLARRSYGDSERALAIASLNGVEDPKRLRADQRLRLPVFGDIPAVAAPALPDPPEPAGEPTLEPARAPGPAPDLGSALSAAIGAFHDGEFAAARSALETLRLAVIESGTERQQRALHEHLLLVSVAFDDPEAACRNLQEIGPPDALDPEHFSPKVIELAASCR
jgi:LysM repeat protein